MPEDLPNELQVGIPGSELQQTFSEAPPAPERPIPGRAADDTLQ